MRLPVVAVAFDDNFESPQHDVLGVDGSLRWQFLPGHEDTGTVISSSSISSAPTGYRFPREVIAVAVR